MWAPGRAGPHARACPAPTALHAPPRRRRPRPRSFADAGAAVQVTRGRPRALRTSAPMDNRCLNRVATGASLGGALGASIGAVQLAEDTGWIDCILFLHRSPSLKVGGDVLCEC